MEIRVKNGVLRGTIQDLTAVFKEIPFAKPPVGDLRWRAPQSAEDWEGVRDATAFGNASAQPVMQIGETKLVEEPVSEDCLYLNVWTPLEAVKVGGRLPVMVVIHGGGFQVFSGAYDVLQGKELSEQGMVVVTVNYRLGALGFMAHPGLCAENEYGASGNYGIMDQIAALRWVQENIAAFGGDPDQVTVCGESVGSFSVSILCMSPLTEGLFCRATAQSGAFMDKKTIMYQLRTADEAGKKNFGVIIEVKYATDERQLEHKAQEAPEQITAKRYDEFFGIDVPPEIIHYGIAFHKKKCRVKIERVQGA